MKLNSKNILLITAVLLMQCGCGPKKASDPLADSGRTVRTETLAANIDSVSLKGCLIGQQDATLYGIGWQGDSARSDIQTVSSEPPAIVGFEVGGVEHGWKKNLNGVLLDTVRKSILAQYDASGVCVVTWHVANRPNWKQLYKLCDFLNSLDEPYGVRVPVILRPCTPCQNLNFWQRLTESIEAKGVTNVLLAYTVTPDDLVNGKAEAKSISPLSEENMAKKIDVIGLDDYYLSKSTDEKDMKAFADGLDKALGKLTSLGEKYKKTVGIVGTGAESIQQKDWFTATLLPVINKHQFSFLLFGRNDNNHPGHYFVPFPGQHATSDFVKFVNAPKTLLLHDINGLYLTK